MKISKFIIDSILQEKGLTLEYYENRRMGTSTGLIYKYISEAMLNPNTWIKITDHYDSYHSHKMLLNRVKDVVKNNNLMYFNYDEISNCIRYTPFYDIEE